MENEKTVEQEWTDVITGKADVERRHGLGDDTHVHTALVLGAAMLIELAADCENDEWCFSDAELQASRLHVDGIRKALACIERRLIADEQESAQDAAKGQAGQ
jgi:hypothetical protein